MSENVKEEEKPQEEAAEIKKEAEAAEKAKEAAAEEAEAEGAGKEEEKAAEKQEAEAAQKAEKAASGEAESEAAEKAEEAEAEAADKVEEEVEAKEASQPKAQHRGPKKGLMERRESFSQTSVPNAHKGYNPKTPVVMLGILVIFFIASFILAAVSS